MKWSLPMFFLNILLLLIIVIVYFIRCLEILSSLVVLEVLLHSYTNTFYSISGNINYWFKGWVWSIIKQVSWPASSPDYECIKIAMVDVENDMQGHVFYFFLITEYYYLPPLKQVINHKYTLLSTHMLFRALPVCCNTCTTALRTEGSWEGQSFTSEMICIVESRVSQVFKLQGLVYPLDLK